MTVTMMSLIEDWLRTWLLMLRLPNLLAATAAEAAAPTLRLLQTEPGVVWPEGAVSTLAWKCNHNHNYNCQFELNYSYDCFLVKTKIDRIFRVQYPTNRVGAQDRKMFTIKEASSISSSRCNKRQMQMPLIKTSWQQRKMTKLPYRSSHSARSKMAQFWLITPRSMARQGITSSNLKYVLPSQNVLLFSTK